MRTQLPDKWMKFLLSKPESGMGYQRVDVVFSDGTVARDCLVFNASEIQLPDSEAEKEIAKLSMRSPKTP